MQDVEYLIIGAGMAGLTCRHFLQSDSTVIIDSAPGRYKIGESVIPEHYQHPELGRLLPKVEQLPSYSPKLGSLFVSDTHVTSYPLPKRVQQLAMHVSRHEVEPLMIQEWGIDVRTERVISVDVATRTVTTDHEVYRVRRQIIDCSGPSMVVAHSLGDVQELWPVNATWTYFDIEANDDQKFFESLGHREYRRFQFSVCRLLPGQEDADWSPSKTTLLTRVREGVWIWQIPLHHATLLSFGVVSRHGKVSKEELYELAQTKAAPNYTLRARPLDNSSPYNKLYVRNNFAKIAGKASTQDYILVADAYGFADPIYSVGTGLAVNKGRELAEILNNGGWNEERSKVYNEKYRELINNAVEAFEFWYNEGVMKDDQVAMNVQTNFLIGNVFQLGLSHHLERLVDSSKDANDPDADGFPRQKGKFDPLDMAEKTRRIRDLLALPLGETLKGWSLMGGYPTLKGLQVRWMKEGKPELVVLFWKDDGVTPSYRTVNNLSMGYLHLLDGKYPSDEETKALLEHLATSVKEHVSQWKALLPA